MYKKAILAASFGTTKDETRDRNIGALERDIAAEFPGCAVARAFTSSIVIRSLRARGIDTDTPEQALSRLSASGAEDVFIQPAHLIPGEEYEKLLTQAETFRGRFKTLRIAKPLLYSAEDMQSAAKAVLEAYPAEPDTALILMGHGTAHFSNCVYPAMDYVLKSCGGAHAFVATVEGWPKIGDTLDAVVSRGYRRALLVPFMLTAGDHAMNDMAGDGPESWKNLCRERGIETRCVLRGLGELPAIRKMYIGHLRACMEACPERHSPLAGGCVYG